MKVKGGGIETPRGFIFEISAGSLCLDLANTVDKRPTERPTERLERYADLVSWAEQAEVLTRRAGRQMLRAAAARPRRARAALSRARSLREALFGIFSAAANGRPAPDEALAMLNAALPDALAGLRVVPSENGFEWGWSVAERGLDRILPPVLDSAAELLTSPDLARVRECGADTCAWLFLDKSRNRSRRWCDMTVCGNRAKARRHYQREKRRSGKSRSG
jgi:predicted RNA-binding Zn ribbon-like protein